MNSGMWKLNLNDFEKGLIVAVLTAIITPILQSLQAGSLDFNWSAILMTAITALLAYLAKNLATDNQGNFLGIGK